MAKISFKGIDAYSKKLASLDKSLETRVLGPAIYDGAEIVMDCVVSKLKAVPTDDDHKQSGKKKGPDTADKEAVLHSLGIAPLQTDPDGYVNVKIGAQKAYYGPPTAKYPNGRPVLMVLRSISSGTSFMEAHPFMKAAVRESRKPAEAAMEKRVTSEIDEIMRTKRILQTSRILPRYVKKG